MSHSWQGKKFHLELSPSRKIHGQLEFELSLSLSLGLFTRELSSSYALEVLS